MPTQKPTWRLWHWSACPLIYRQWICLKQVHLFCFLFSHLHSLGWPVPENTNISMHWQRVAFALTFPLNVILHPVCSNVIPVPEPCLDSFVFLRVKERQENILVEPETDDQRYFSSTWNYCSQTPQGGSVTFFHSALRFFSAWVLKQLILSLLCSLLPGSMLWIWKRALSI